jgi:hypothetical protein
MAPLPLVMKQYTVDGFAKAIDGLSWGNARITEVHWHHTYQPDHAAFRRDGAEKLVRAMYRFHTQTRGWRHLGQHVTIDPAGYVWQGRPWTLTPASAVGHNGTEAAHPFMFEMIGDFRSGRDALTGAQLDAASLVTAVVQRKFGLVPDKLRFHKHMQATECPGALDKDAIIAGVRKMHDLLQATPPGQPVMAEETYAPSLVPRARRG